MGQQSEARCLTLGVAGWGKTEEALPRSHSRANATHRKATSKQAVFRRSEDRLFTRQLAASRKQAREATGQQTESSRFRNSACAANANRVGVRNKRRRCSGGEERAAGSSGECDGCETIQIADWRVRADRHYVAVDGRAV